jgi:DNA (cytosine-5)-methyltransferase 1
MTVRFIDLFSGIGGFHAAGASFGWECVFASEIDKDASDIYELNWKIKPSGDIRQFTGKPGPNKVPQHDVLFAGFPCQPFSKSGKQLGMSEDRGSLFYDILDILKKNQPAMLVLENVRNIAGPKHRHEWDFIIDSLRKAGYRVSAKPFVVSPHRIPPSYGGAPQARERVFIVGTRVPSQMKSLISDNEELVFPTDFDGWDPSNWNLAKHLPIDPNNSKDMLKYRLKEDEVEVINAWEALLQVMLKERGGLRLPGFPLWSDIWGKRPIYEKVADAPDWKLDFEAKNRRFYLEHREIIDQWFRDYPIIRQSGPSRRKLEWQAQDMQSIWNGLIHIRPSGIRVKRATYVPTLVAITQTSIYGPQKRRLSVRESARLQGMKDEFNFGSQSDQASYKQLGNGVSVGAVYQVVRAAVERDQQILAITAPKLVKSVRSAPISPFENVHTETKKKLKTKSN